MLKITAQQEFNGVFSFPGDKSITHRAIMLNSSANGEAVITNASVSEDCLSTCQCMRALGADIVVDGTNIRVQGVSKFCDGLMLDCGNSATTMRILTGLLAGRRTNAVLYGDESLSSRPMSRVAKPLALLGAEVLTNDGHAPVTITGKPLFGTSVRLEIPSAQVKSAVLLAGLGATGKTRVIESIASRNHTERMLSAMHANIHVDGNVIEVEQSELCSLDIRVPSDISSAVYFMALGALKGEVVCKDIAINPTRTGILTAFDRLGVRYTLQNNRVSGGEEIADITVYRSDMRAITLTETDIPSMIDELPIIALLCAFADGESVITGAKELRVKESDRIQTVTALLNGLGGECVETDDGFIIRGKKSLQGGKIDGGVDHRIVMTGAVALLASERGGEISHPERCAVSFPDFFAKLGIKSY